MARTQEKKATPLLNREMKNRTRREFTLRNWAPHNPAIRHQMVHRRPPARVLVWAGHGKNLLSTTVQGTPKVLQDLADHRMLGEETDDPHLSAAVRAAKGIHLVNYKVCI